MTYELSIFETINARVINRLFRPLTHGHHSIFLFCKLGVLVSQGSMDFGQAFIPEIHIDLKFDLSITSSCLPLPSHVFRRFHGLREKTWKSLKVA